MKGWGFGYKWKSWLLIATVRREDRDMGRCWEFSSGFIFFPNESEDGEDVGVLKRRYKIIL